MHAGLPPHRGGARTSHLLVTSSLLFPTYYSTAYYAHALLTSTYAQDAFLSFTHCLPLLTADLPALLGPAEELPQVVSTAPHPRARPRSTVAPSPSARSPWLHPYPTPAAVEPHLYSCRYPPPVDQGSDDAKKDDEAALAAKLTHIGSLEKWWSKGPEVTPEKVVTQA